LGSYPDFFELSKTELRETLDNGVEVEDIAGDKAYSTSDILRFGIEKNINIISKLKENGSC